MDQVLADMNPTLLLAVALWSLPWKAWALWLAARRGDFGWFMTICFLGTLGILEMIYIFFVAKQSDKREDTTQMHE